MTEAEKTRELLKRLFDKIDGRKLLLDFFVQSGVPFQHPDTGKWHDRSGLGFDTYDALEKYGDAFIHPDPQPGFKLR